jgi:predicted nuclease of predicted toxin-antitoxin system
MIIIDENVDQSLVTKLKDYTTNVISIRDEHPGISDQDVIMIAKSNKGLVITEDKDFGELVFSHNLRGCSVMLLRYDKSDLAQMEHNIFKALQYYKNQKGHMFMTITGKKIRIRKI